MPRVLIDNVEINNWLDIGEISDSLTPSGSAFTIEIMGYPPTNKLGAVRVEVYDDQGDLAAIGTGIPTIKNSLRPRTTYNVSSFYSQLQRKKIVGQYNSTLITILRQLIIDGSADMYFTGVTFRTAYDTPDLIINQYIDYQFLKDALSLVLLGAGRQLSYKIPIDDTTIQIIEPGYAPNAPVATLSIDSLYACSHLGIKSINYNKINPLASVIRVFGRNGHNIDSSGKTILNPDILRYRAQAGRTQYPTQLTCDEILFIRITPEENASCLIISASVSGICQLLPPTPTNKGFYFDGADLGAVGDPPASGQFEIDLTGIDVSAYIWRIQVSYTLDSVGDTGTETYGVFQCFVQDDSGFTFVGDTDPIARTYAGNYNQGLEQYIRSFYVDLSSYTNITKLLVFYDGANFPVTGTGLTGTGRFEMMRVCRSPGSGQITSFSANTAGTNPTTTQFTLVNPNTGLPDFFGFIMDLFAPGGSIGTSQGSAELSINNNIIATITDVPRQVFIPIDESLIGTTIDIKLEVFQTSGPGDIEAQVGIFYA